MNIEKLRELAPHYRALGNTSHHFFSPDDEIPWHLATRCQAGGSHRMEIATDVRFHGYDPESGLWLYWSWDLEPRSADGKGHYELNVEGAREVLSKLAPQARASFAAYLQSCVKAVRKKAEEWEAITARQYAFAKALESIDSAA